MPLGFEDSAIGQQSEIGHSNATASNSIYSGVEGGGSMFPGLENGGINIATASLDSAFPPFTGNFNSVFTCLKQGVFNQSITNNLANTLNHLGAKEAQGDNIRLDDIGSEITKHGITGVQGDLQIGALSFRGNGGGEAQGH